MEVIFNMGKVEICIKTGTINSKWEPVFGKNTYDDIKKMFSKIVQQITMTHGYSISDAEFSYLVYSRFKSEYCIPLVYSKVGQFVHTNSNAPFQTST